VIPAGEAGKAVDGQYVIVEITVHPTARRQATGRVVEVMGDYLSPGMEIEVAMRTHGIQSRWTQSLADEIVSLQPEVLEADKVGRKDLRDLPLVTIDGETARDFRFGLGVDLPCLAATAEDQYVCPYGDGDDARSARRLQRRKVEREAGEQKDIIATSLKREADLILKRGGPDALRNIGNLYDRALRDYGGSITGFKMMAADYFNFFKDDKELAHKAARDVELAFKRVVETGSKDWFRAQAESSIYQMICSYYRTAGDTARADMLEKRYELLLRRAKRGAL